MHWLYLPPDHLSDGFPCGPLHRLGYREFQQLLSKIISFFMATLPILPPTIPSMLHLIRHHFIRTLSLDGPFRRFFIHSVSYAQFALQNLERHIRLQFGHRLRAAEMA